MSFVPKSTRFPKFQKKRFRKRVSSSLLSLRYGCVGLKVQQNGYVTSQQLDMMRSRLGKETKKVGRF